MNKHKNDKNCSKEIDDIFSQFKKNSPKEGLLKLEENKDFKEEN